MQCLSILMVPTERLELSRLSPPPPQDGVSTNSTTSASFLLEKQRSLSRNCATALRFCYLGTSLVFESGSPAGLSGVGTGTAPAGSVAGAVVAGCVAITPFDVPLCA